MEGVLEKSLAEEKFENLLLQEQQDLEKQARLLSNSYQGARVLLSKDNDDDQFNVYGLLQNRDLLVNLEPSLSDQFDILQYFYDNNLLDVDQVLIAVNNIRSHETMLRCVNEANKTVHELNSVQKKIKASKSMSDNDLLVIKNTLSEDLLSVILLQEDKVVSILDYFYKVGVNILDLILLKGTILYENIDFIKDKIESSLNPNFLDLIKEDPSSLDLIGL